MEGAAAVEESDHDKLSNGGRAKRHRRRLGKGIIYFRQIGPEDRQAVQTLHEQWFPVDYKPDFFDSLCNNSTMPGTNQPLYSCVACFKELDDVEFEAMYEKRERESCSMPSLLWSKGKKNSLTSKYYCNETNDECILWEGQQQLLDDDDDNNDDDSGTIQNENYSMSTMIDVNSDDCDTTTANDDVSRIKSLHQANEREKIKQFYSNGFRFDYCNSQHNNTGKEDADCNLYVNECGEFIAGCVVGSFLPSSMYSAKTGGRDETATLLVPDPDEYPQMFYIMTLGTSREFRRVGLGSILVNRVVDMIKSKQECGALYLHVIIYNEVAIKLYERLGFARVKRITGERSSALNFRDESQKIILAFTLTFVIYSSHFFQATTLSIL